MVFNGTRKSSFAKTAATSPCKFLASIGRLFSFKAFCKRVFFATCSFAPAFLSWERKTDRSFTLMPWKSTKKKPFWLSKFFWSFSKVCCFCAFVWGIRLKNKRLLSQTRQNRIFGSHLGRVYSFGSTSIFTSFKSQCFLRKPAVCCNTRIYQRPKSVKLFQIGGFGEVVFFQSFAEHSFTTGL